MKNILLSLYARSLTAGIECREKEPLGFESSGADSI